jgi:hypothetical protein
MLHPDDFTATLDPNDLDWQIGKGIYENFLSLLARISFFRRGHAGQVLSDK